MKPSNQYNSSFTIFYMVLNPAGVLLFKLLKDERIDDFSEFYSTRDLFSSALILSNFKRERCHD